MAQNHNLIYSYIHLYGIPLNEYYDVLAIALCDAARGYDDEKGSFSTYAYECFYNAMYQTKEQEKRSASNAVDAISYEEFESFGYPDGEDGLLDNSSYDDAIYGVMRDELAGKMTKREREVFLYLLNGVPAADIARIFKCKKQSVFYYVEKIRKRVSAYLGK